MSLNKTKRLIGMRKTNGSEIVTVASQEFCTFRGCREGKGSGQEVRVSPSHHSSQPGGSSSICFFFFIHLLSAYVYGQTLL